HHPEPTGSRWATPTSSEIQQNPGHPPILADTYDVNVAPHNYHGQQLATFISAHMAAALPNFRVMEYVADEPSWTVEFLTQPLTIENGALVLPTGPGWGTEINEEAVRARPPRQRY
ncbi:hypothetical protein MXD81_50730, partial [Microbacteriaceae bacterium K1510]|nr:hypothetical protein [Microbacteriaceae bacterium K1510]